MRAGCRFRSPPGCWGIGETLVERAETIHAIRSSHKEFGHVQK